MTVIQAPSRNLATRTTRRVTPVANAPNAVNEHTVEAPRGVGAFPMDHHARPGKA